ncbi:N-acetylmuramoyl-L-alanine amidase [Phycisphaerae bacterium RAS1]|nr:N-acetylmuramoyl-L-alanine amidase [Phycisphaerae bacterium RAS1]
MQRSARALSIGMVLSVIAGCTPTTERITTRPPPEPLLVTKPPARLTPIAPTPRPEVRPPDEGPLGISREELIPRNLRRGQWQCIVVHHADSAVATPQSMHDYHLRVKKWENGLGYHLVIGNGVNYPDGKIYVGPRWKRQIQGAHCASSAGRYFGVQREGGYFNERGIGICLIGDFQTGRPTAKQLRVLTALIEFLCAELRINQRDIYGHGEVTHKTACPGRNMSMGTLRRAVAAGGAFPGARFSNGRLLGRNADLAAALQREADRLVPVANLSQEGFGALDVAAFDALNHVADGVRELLDFAIVADDFEDVEAGACGPALVMIDGEFYETQAAPQDYAVAQPAHACGVAALQAHDDLFGRAAAHPRQPHVDPSGELIEP